MFSDREDAGRQLAARLLPFRAENPCILALPRGGVPIGFEVAKALNAPLDLVLVRKIGAPFQPELAIGAIVDGNNPELVLNDGLVDSLDLKAYVTEESARQLKEIERRRQAYLGDRPRLDVRGRTVLIVDDGIATGATIKAAIHATRRAHPKRVVLAVPVAPSDTIATLRKEADEVICLEEHEDFWAIGNYYDDFSQVSDDAVRDLMSRSAPLPSTTPRSSEKHVVTG